MKFILQGGNWGKAVGSGQEPRPDFLQSPCSWSIKYSASCCKLSFLDWGGIPPTLWDLELQQRGWNTSLHCECTDQISTSPTKRTHCHSNRYIRYSSSSTQKQHSQVIRKGACLHAVPSFQISCELKKKKFHWFHLSICKESPGNRKGILKRNKTQNHLMGEIQEKGSQPVGPFS